MQPAEPPAGGATCRGDREQNSAMSGHDSRGPFVVDVATLRRRPGSRREVRVEGEIPELFVTASRVPEGASVVVDGVLESVSGGLLVTAKVSAPYEGQCRRCLEVALGRVEAQVVELVGDEPDPDTGYVLDGDKLDLRDIAHDACILELPIAPLCREECLGLCPKCGANRNTEHCSCVLSADPRWAALAELGDPDVSERADLPAGCPTGAPGEKTP